VAAMAVFEELEPRKPKMGNARRRARVDVANKRTIPRLITFSTNITVIGTILA
jgi:hypothetical protein